ncbi:MAG: hypothetical protein ACI9AX_001977 [Polaromonas sp.]|jgi:hypothetical protein
MLLTPMAIFWSTSSRPIVATAISWAVQGAEAGKFSIPYAVAVLKGDQIAVADREYNCVQIFAPDDSVERQIAGL